MPAPTDGPWGLEREAGRGGCRHQRGRKGEDLLGQRSHWLCSVEGERALPMGNQTQRSCWCRVTRLLTRAHMLAPGSLYSNAHTLEMKSGCQVETAWEPRGGAGESLGRTSAVSTAETQPERDTCVSGVPLFPVSKVANSSQAACPRNWGMVLTKIA